MVHDLGIIMLVAGVISILFKWLKQPVVLGYIVAGLLAGPYVAGSEWVDVKSVETWGQVGVTFLLFSLGLDFSFKKLLQLGPTAVIGFITITVGMMSVGFLLGRTMGWDEMNSLFLAGMLCMQSTTIIFKALEDLGLLHQKFAGICFGISVLGDLFSVVLMVMLASIAVNQKFEGTALLWQVSKLAAYLLFWFVAGIMIIPTLLKKFRKYLNDETLTIVSLGLCIGMVLLAKDAGFSEALGAFVMGSIMAETVEAERIGRLVAPIKNLFGAIFFVSVGMLINPAILAEYWGTIAIIVVTVIVGLIVFGTLGIVLSGQPLKTAMQAAFSLTQIGEFAFIIAMFGESIGVTQPFLYPVIVAVSAITTFLTPFTIRLAVPAYNFVEPRIPGKVRLLMARLQSGRDSVSQQSVLRALLKKVGVSAAVYFIVCLFLTTLYMQIASPWIVDAISRLLSAELAFVGRLVGLLVILTVLSPFVYRMIVSCLHAPETRQLWQGGNYKRISLVALFSLKFIVGLAFVIYCISHYFTMTYGVVVGIAVLVMAIILMSKKIHLQSAHIEESFMTNLSAREVEQDKHRAVRKGLEQEFLNYDLHLSDFELSAESDFCGKTLRELDLRRTCGVNVVRIVRGGLNVNVPGGDERVYPHDRIVVAGSDAQIGLFQQQLDNADRLGTTRQDPESRRTTVSLEQLTVTPDMDLCGKTLAESHIREKAQCAVLGVEHDGQSSMNPDSSIVLSAGDTLILAGEADRIRALVDRESGQE